ncbi:hypothetical protein EVAR_47670_1 [Eumeta japonica]|uniref:Uncharacterized protein n=1 Tax=Eumeta variegata TaxID=151549 RepID=A0A4C1Y120_EUMVA|nr:hypothetical protein EVAR_47670_1 [Eumeta japonica]
MDAAKDCVCPSQAIRFDNQTPARQKGKDKKVRLNGLNNEVRSRRPRRARAPRAKAHGRRLDDSNNDDLKGIRERTEARVAEKRLTIHHYGYEDAAVSAGWPAHGAVVRFVAPSVHVAAGPSIRRSDACDRVGETIARF